MPIKKFSDKQFLELYNQKYNDYEIAKILNVHHNVVWGRRNKLGLLPNGLIQYRSIPEKIYNNNLEINRINCKKFRKKIISIIFTLDTYVYLIIDANKESGNYARSRIKIGV